MSEYTYLECSIPTHIVKQIRAEAIDELVSKIKGYMESTECSTYIDELNNDNGTYSAMPIYDYVDDLAEQLKEQKNG